ncbi:DUF6332 family protein [Streptomyces sp. SCSIO 30461]|uniref:DUF6332 family protein n=1 Tax=Streptomyces sp. SCSIO 30461 TaxID=3118085 RepID=UPI0030CF69D9
MGRRTQAQRDAITVEIGYALISAFFAAAVVTGAVAGPALALDPPRSVAHALATAGLVLGAVVFVARVVHVLWRFPRAGGAGRQGRTGRADSGS